MHGCRAFRPTRPASLHVQVRAVYEPSVCRPQHPRHTPFTRKHPIHDLVGKVVGAWKIGRIVDSALVDQPDERNIALSVSVEWVGWRSLKEQYPWCGIAETWINYDITSPYPYSFCQVFNWPSVVTKDGVIEEPTVPERSKYEVVLDKHVAANDERGAAHKRRLKTRPPAPWMGVRIQTPRSSAANEQSNEDLTGANETLPLVQNKSAQQTSSPTTRTCPARTRLPSRLSQNKSVQQTSSPTTRTCPARTRLPPLVSERRQQTSSPTRTARRERDSLPLVSEQERAANDSPTTLLVLRGTKRTVAFLDDATTSTVDDELLRQAETKLDIVTRPVETTKRWWLC